MRIWTLLLLLLFTFTATLAADGPITFKFAPTVGMSYIDQNIQQGTLQVREQKIATFQKTLVNIKVAKEGDNFLFIGTSTEAQATMNNQPYMDEILNLLKGLTITDVVNARGEVIDVKGDDTLRARAKEKLPAKMAAATAQVFSHASILEQEQATASRRISRFVGRTVNIGDAWIDTFVYPVSNLQEEIAVYRHTRIDGWAKVGEKDVLRIKVICDASAEGLAKAIGKTAKDITAAVKNPLAESKDRKLAASGELLLDPATMNVYGETETLDAAVAMKLSPNVTVPASYAGKSETTLIYH